MSGPSNDGGGVARDTVLQELRPGAGLKTSDFVEEKLGELVLATVVTVERRKITQLYLGTTQPALKEGDHH